MSVISGPRRQLYGLCLGLFLLADLAGGAAVVVARAGGPAPAATDLAPTTDLASPATVLAPPSSRQTDCGQGSATARAVLDRTDSGYVLRVTVANDSNRTVELDRLVVRADTSDGVRTFDAAVEGQWISSGVPQREFAVPGSASVTPPARFAVTDFAFHTAGLPACVAR
jgi:hypothetical protein